MSFLFIIIFKLYNIVLVLPNIEMSFFKCLFLGKIFGPP